MEARPAGPQLARPDNHDRETPLRGVKFHSLTEGIDDTAAPTDHAMWQMIGVLADYAERAVMQSAGAEIAFWR
jgi:hypothetical protein